MLHFRTCLRKTSSQWCDVIRSENITDSLTDTFRNCLETLSHLKLNYQQIYLHRWMDVARTWHLISSVDSHQIFPDLSIWHQCGFFAYFFSATQILNCILVWMLTYLLPMPAYLFLGGNDHPVILDYCLINVWLLFDYSVIAFETKTHHSSQGTRLKAAKKAGIRDQYLASHSDHPIQDI